MTQYEEVQLEAPSQPLIKRTDADGKVFWIPKDPSNSDYQRYLRWLNGEEEQKGM